MVGVQPESFAIGLAVGAAWITSMFISFQGREIIAEIVVAMGMLRKRLLKEDMNKITYPKQENQNEKSTD